MGSAIANIPDAAEREPCAGSRVGPYRLVGIVGSGGMGIVFEALHERIGQRAAVKVMVHGRGAQSTAARRRFLNEARALSRVAHPGLVRIFDCGETPAGVPWISMEFVAGESLRARLDRLASHGQRMRRDEAVRSARQIASAVAVIHRAGIVHRDLKPDNIMIVPDDEASGGERVKLLDFGIAKLLDSDGPLTTGGTVLGTAAYMAPEQCVGAGEIDGRADVYALGVMLYELLAAERPFQGDATSIMRQHLFVSPAPIEDRVPDLPPALPALLGAMLAKEPSLRPAMDAVVERLRAIEASAPGALLPFLDPAPGGMPGRRTGPRHDATLPRANERALASTRAAQPPEVKASFGSSAVTIPEAPRARWKRLWIAAPFLLAGALVAVMTLRRLEPKKPSVVLTNMVYLPGGTFRMGSTSAEIDAECRRLGAECPRALLEREQPAHDVTVSPFHLDVREVTNAELAAWLQMVTATLEVSEDDERHIDRWVRQREERLLLVDLYPDHSGIVHRAGNFSARPGFEGKPAVQVTWDAARLYCEAKGKRLPTEAEWELAARGTRSRQFPWGNQPPHCDGVVYGRNAMGDCRGKPLGSQDVGTAAQDRTPEGILDLGGNVGEWVFDQFRLPYYAPCGDCIDPRIEEPTPLADDLRIFRGGSWESPDTFSRAAARSRWKRSDVMNGLGFRCASQ